MAIRPGFETISQQHAAHAQQKSYSNHAGYFTSNPKSSKRKRGSAGSRVYKKCLGACNEGNRIPESGKHLLVESGMLGFESGIHLKESGIPLTVEIQNPSSNDKDLNPVPEIRNPRRGIQNPRLSRIRLHKVKCHERKFNCVSNFRL